ncbi:MAG TPA: glycosyltransferase family A protein [Casimicrobiaceae bacterium]|nr:glycosyltransferase family A protein [Casimicrobiaceae bacterium]
MISCCTVTQEGRLPLLARAIADFRGQSVHEKELIVVHDGSLELHGRVSALTAQAAAPVSVIRAPQGTTLGALRNAAIDAAHGEHVCQWDDDDRYHPRRLEMQLDALRAAGADASFLVDQLHYFADARELYWDDWQDEPNPLDFVPGSLLARRDRLARYPEIARGEDTAQALAMLREGTRFTRLSGHGYLYVYVFHGSNTFDRVHHAMISRRRCLRADRLLALEALLRARLAEYAPPLGALTMPYEGGRLEFRR